MIKDPVVCGKADSICSSATVGKCNMGNPTTYPYNLSGILLPAIILKSLDLFHFTYDVTATSLPLILSPG
jgi:hypothetical protein